MGHETNDSLKKPFPVHKARANREEADHQNCGGKNDYLPTEFAAGIKSMRNPSRRTERTWFAPIRPALTSDSGLIRQIHCRWLRAL